MLSDEQKAFFMDMDQLFNSPGWARLKQGWDQEIEMIPAAAFYNSKSMEELKESQVRIGLLSELVQLPETIERMKAELLENSKDAEKDD